MDTDKILRSSYLDLVFDGRNKAYGSYVLRQTYAYRMRRAAAFLLLTTCIALGYKVMGERSAPKTVLAFPGPTVSVNPIELKPVLPEKPIPIPEKPSAPAAPVKTFKLVDPDVARDKEVTETMVSQRELEHAVVGNKLSLDGDSMALASPDLVDPKAKGNGGTGIEHTGGKTGFNPKIEVFVEQPPEFPGGQDQLYKYLREHLQYPAAASNAGQQGKVQVKFVVNEDGSISNIETVRGFGYGSEQEAIRVVSGMPRWKPGRNNGVAVKVWFNLPVSFIMGN